MKKVTKSTMMYESKGDACHRYVQKYNFDDGTFEVISVERGRSDFTDESVMKKEFKTEEEADKFAKSEIEIFKRGFYIP